MHYRQIHMYIPNTKACRRSRQYCAPNLTPWVPCCTRLLSELAVLPPTDANPRPG